MFQPWRLKLKEAKEALRDGRLEEASRMLRESDVREFLPAKQMLVEVANRMAERAGTRMKTGQSSAGWRDLEAAASLGADPQAVAGLRSELVQRRLTEAEAYLAAGEPAAAIARLDEMDRHAASTREVRILREAAAKVLAARRHTRHGDFGAAEDELAAAAALRSDIKALEDARKACTVKAVEVRKLSEGLHEALSAQEWTRVVAAAEALLELCPEHEAARDARRRAWAAVGTRLAESRRPGLAARPSPATVVVQRPQLCRPESPEPSPASSAVRIANMDEHTTSSPRLLLWVDGVGGFLVCLGNEVTIGQPVPGSQVDVPILADISRRHATIRRDAESFLIQPLRPVRIDSKETSERTVLGHGQLVELGGGVQLRFLRPHPLSGTARIDFVSHHRTQPSSSAVLLMAESCILGPGANSHVVCRNWPSDLVLFRHGEELYCRAPGAFEVDGQAVTGKAALTTTSRVSGEGFSFSLEEI